MFSEWLKRIRKSSVGFFLAVCFLFSLCGADADLDEGTFRESARVVECYRGQDGS